MQRGHQKKQKNYLKFEQRIPTISSVTDNQINVGK